ncbi:16S rRNA (cytosine(967)-C(5))-methyltransferase RsmB [Caviibacter abscessus]|uniref:16S rRNA (cytosine(967)-C(5))-methyltransferase RsmB n=1 Tax=Caviibacter abscessus TaxID=1766719 RepID=UPI00082C1944|nr:16S rRNA (cytosine(967)-C(5))-methyltransferase RsmB [Caviibacter abscessus]
MIKDDIIHLLDNIIEKNKFSNIEINYYFNIKNYTKAEKAFIKNVLSETMKNLIYIDYIIDFFAKNVSKRKIRQLLRISVAQILFMDSDNKGVVYEAVEIAKLVNIHQGKFVNSVLKNVINNIDKVNESIAENNKLSIMLSYPKWIVEKIKIDWSDDYEEILKSFKQKSYLSVRINRKKINREQFLDRIKDIDTKILFEVEDVFYVSNSKIMEAKIFNDDEIFFQDASSYIVAKNMDIKDSARVLDACCAPGGKTLAMLSLYNPKKIICTDIYDHKIDLLKSLKEKYNYENMEVIKNDASHEGSFYEKYFDKILLDVPCSGLGVLRKKPEKVYSLQLSDIKALKKLQKKIFETNLTYLKDDGELIYSTCTITKNENTNNVKYFLEKYNNLKVLPLEIPENVQYETDEFGGVYISHKNKYLDGFYIIKFKKIKDM